jgi:Ca2+-binding RTX toxin-like protein
MRRRARLIMASMGLGVLLLGGVALADTIDGTSGPDDLVGTDKDDVIHASGGADYVSGLAGPDLLYAGAGNDTVVGREGNDRIYGNTGYDLLFGKKQRHDQQHRGQGKGCCEVRDWRRRHGLRR